MPDWQPYREPLRTTLTRTIGIAIVAAAFVALSSGGLRRWPSLVAVMLWPAFGGHWVDLLFLNWLRPRLPDTRIVQRIARLAIWFVGGVLIGIGVRVTAAVVLPRASMAWLTWPVAGIAFIAVELAAHAVLQFRGRPSFYNGRG